MKVIFKVTDHLALPPLALTIGNFDGVHIGHQTLIRELQKITAKRPEVKTAVLLFEPQPLEFFKKHQAPARIYSLRDKLVALQNLGVDYVIVQKFHTEFSMMSPESFIQNYLVRCLKVAYLLVGDDFRFGHARSGGYELLETYAEILHFELASMKDISLNDLRVSSTEIRTALTQANFLAAEKFLGRPYRMCGRVIHGNKRGRVLGFPTANLAIKRRVSPLQGIYVVKVYGLSDHPLPAVASIGYRPVFHGKELLLEVYILDFNQQIYGKYLEIEFLHKLRDEANYESVEKLVAQIQQDVKAARAFFSGSFKISFS